MDEAQVNVPQASHQRWLDVHGQAAMMEGWSVFECSGSANGQWQIQRLDDASDVPGAQQLERDEDAWSLVLQGKGEHHAAALRFLKNINPMEHDAIAEFGRRHEAGQPSS